PRSYRPTFCRSSAAAAGQLAGSGLTTAVRLSTWPSTNNTLAVRECRKCTVGYRRDGGAREEFFSTTGAPDVPEFVRPLSAKAMVADVAATSVIRYDSGSSSRLKPGPR